MPTFQLLKEMLLGTNSLPNLQPAYKSGMEQQELSSAQRDASASKPCPLPLAGSAAASAAPAAFASASAALAAAWGTASDCLDRDQAIAHLLSSVVYCQTVLNRSPKHVG